MTLRWHIIFLFFLGFGNNVQCQTTVSLDVSPLPRRALVIGMGSYEVTGGSQRQILNDANAMGDMLENLGFQVTRIKDKPLHSLRISANQFIESVAENDIVVVYYAGHGTQISTDRGNQNYLIPVDYQRHLTVDPDNLYPVSEIIQDLRKRHTALNIIILDACRSNAAFAGTSAGLAEMEAAPDTFIAMATSPGSIVTDNESSDHGIFTSEIIVALKIPDVPLDEVFRRVRENVAQRTAQQQRPSVSTNALVPFVFRDDVQNEYAARRIASQLNTARKKWNEVQQHRRILREKQEQEAQQDRIEREELQRLQARLEQEQRQRKQEHDNLEEISRTLAKEAEEKLKQEINRQEAESQAAVELLQIRDNTEINENLTLAEAREKVLKAYATIADRRAKILSEQQKVLAVINVEYAKKRQRLSKQPESQGMFETRVQFEKRRRDHAATLAELENERKARLARNIETYKIELESQIKPFEDQIKNITIKLFPAERIQANWNSYDPDRGVLLIASGPFLYRFEADRVKAEELYHRRDKLKLEFAYRYYEEGMLPVRENVVLIDPLGAHFPRSDPPPVSGFDTRDPDVYWTSNLFDDFEVAASQALDEGSSIAVMLQHHHSLHDVHPVRLLLSRDTISFEVISSGLSTKMIETADTPPSSCGLDNVKASARDLSSVTVSHDKGQVLLTLKIREGISGGSRSYTFADESAHKEQWVSKGMLGVGLVRRSVRSRPEAEHALTAIQHTIQRAADQARLLPVSALTKAHPNPAHDPEATQGPGEQGIAQKKEYKAQLIGLESLNQISVSFIENASLLIYWHQSNTNQLVKLDDIAGVIIKQHSVSLPDPRNNTIVEFTIGPKKPKVYELRLEVLHENGKKFSYHFISDTATCEIAVPSRPCKEGSDGGRQIIELGKAIQQAWEERARMR